MANESISKAATATVDGGVGVLFSCGLAAGGDAATAVVRKGGSGGTIICKLAAAAGDHAERNFTDGVIYSDLHVTLTGTSPVFDAEVGV